MTKKMMFIIDAPGFAYVQKNATKITGNLTSGSVQILTQHQELIGTICSNLVEIETDNENEVKKIVFFVKNSTFVVTTIRNETTVFVRAEDILQISGENVINEINEMLEQQRKEIIIARQNYGVLSTPQNYELIILLESKGEFLKAALIAAKISS